MSGWNNLIINLLGNACVQRNIENFICYASVINGLQSNNNTNQYLQSISNVMTMLVLIVFIELFKVNQEINLYTMEKHRITPADFTVEIQGLRNDITLDQVESFIQSILFQKRQPKAEICKIYYLFDMQPYSQLYQKKIVLYQKKNKISAVIRQQSFQPRKDQQFILQELKRVTQLEQEIMNVDQALDEFEKVFQDFTFRRKSFESDINLQMGGVQQMRFSQQYKESQAPQTIDQQKLLQFSGTILVTLNKSKEAKIIIDSWKHTRSEYFWYRMQKMGCMKKKSMGKLKRFFYQGNLIKIKRASEPSDIIWNNIGTKKSFNRNRFLIQLLIFTIFSANFTILTFVKRKIKTTSHYLNSQLLQIGMSFVASSIVALTNTLIGIILRKFAGLETHKRQTNYYISVGKGLSYLFFINMVCTTLGSNMLSLKINDQTNGFPFDLEGLMNDFFFLFITNTYLSSIFNYFDVVWGWRLFQRNRHLKYGQFDYLSQNEANVLFEGHPADMALRFANVLKVMFFTAAVSPYLPIGIPMSMVGLVILYWVDKYLVLRRYTCKNYLDGQLAEVMMDTLSLYTVFLSLGNIFIMLFPVLQNQSLSKFVWPDFYSSLYFYVAFLASIFSMLYRFIFKYRWIRDFYYKVFNIRIPRKHIQQTYQESKAYFNTDYENYHPVLREYTLPGIEEELGDRIVAPNLFKSIKQRLQE